MQQWWESLWKSEEDPGDRPKGPRRDPRIRKGDTPEEESMVMQSPEENQDKGRLLKSHWYNKALINSHTGANSGGSHYGRMKRILGPDPTVAGVTIGK